MSLQMSEPPNSKVFVGRLPEGCSAKDLEDLFCVYGAVTKCDVIGKYGFVHMTKPEDAEDAIKKLNNFSFMGSTLTVQLSTSKKKEPSAKSKKINAIRNKRTPQFRSTPYPPPPRGPLYPAYGASPPPVPPPAGRFYDDGFSRYNGSNSFYGRGGGGDGPALMNGPPYGRRFPVDDYPRVPPPTRNYYDRGDLRFSRPTYNMPPPEPPRFGFQARNGYGGPSMGYANR